jgi:hypothetical protein
MGYGAHDMHNAPRDRATRQNYNGNTNMSSGQNDMSSMNVSGTVSRVPSVASSTVNAGYGQQPYSAGNNQSQYSGAAQQAHSQQPQHYGKDAAAASAGGVGMYGGQHAPRGGSMESHRTNASDYSPGVCHSLNVCVCACRCVCMYV